MTMLAFYLKINLNTPLLEFISTNLNSMCIYKEFFSQQKSSSHYVLSCFLIIFQEHFLLLGLNKETVVMAESEFP